MTPFIGNTKTSDKGIAIYFTWYIVTTWTDAIQQKPKEDKQMTNKTALVAFIEKKHDIDNALNRLKSLSESHFNANPESINWSDVAELGRIASMLKELTDVAFNEGE